MINLLPIENQKEIKSRRVNLILFKYLITLGASAAFLLIASLSTGIFLDIANNIKEDPTLDNNSGQSSSVSIETRAQNANAILSQQKSYSKLLLGLSNAMPEGVVLKSININKTSIDSNVSAEFLVDKSVAIEKLKNDLENSDLITNATLDQSENIVTALMSINQEALR